MKPEENPTPAPANQSTPSPVAPPAPAPAPTNAPMQAIPAGSEDPGKGLAIAAIIFAFLMPLVGFILGLVARSKSKKAGIKNGLALGAIIVSIITTILGILFIGLIILGAASIVQKCKELGPGTHTVDGVTYTCDSSYTSTSVSVTPSGLPEATTN